MPIRCTARALISRYASPPQEKSSSFKPAFLLWALVLCLLARAAHVYPLLSLVRGGQLDLTHDIWGYKVMLDYVRSLGIG